MALGGRRRSGAERRRRIIALVILVALLLLAFGGGYLLATSGDGGDQASGTSSPPVSPTRSHTPSPTASATGSPTPSSSPSASPVLPEGRSFVYAKKVGGSAGAPTLTFDLALFLTGTAADDASAAHGGEVPAPNGYYIVNDNPRLRTLPIDPAVTILYYPDGGAACCTYAEGTLDGFTAAVNGIAMTDYPDMGYTPWWVTVRDGVIVKIKQQYLP